MSDFSDLPTPASPRGQRGTPDETGARSRGMFAVTFWGVRGNVPAPGAETLRYGGNTSCIEVKVGGQHLIFDGGTGLVALGKALMKAGRSINAHLFFTQTHWDRIQGFPFFLPAFEPTTQLSIYGTAGLNGASIKQLLMNQMLRPYFFTPLQAMKGHLAFHNLQGADTIQLEEVIIETLNLNPKTRALGFRVTWADHTLVYATDTDHTRDQADPNLLFLADGADILIFDGTYADTAYADPIAKHVVPYKLGVQVAQEAQVNQLVLFHHNPCQDDGQLDNLQKEVQAHFPNSLIAREGLTLQLV
jgi:phosphoribosyl 1,2-cyclic phosphodiesterase